MELLACDHTRLLFVIIKDLHLLLGKVGAVDIEVCLIVQAERSIIGVGLAHGNPEVVDDQDFAVVSGWLAFVDFNACIQKRTPAGPAGPVHQLRIVKSARHDDLYGNAAFPGSNEGADG